MKKLLAIGELYPERTSMNPKAQLVTMLHRSLVFAVSVFAATILTAAWMPPAEAQAGPPMKLIQTIPLPKVEGYFDHMAMDIKGQRLFVTASTKGRWK
jgi:hypothetical protein